MQSHIETWFDYLNQYLSQYSKQLQLNVEILCLFKEKLCLFNNQINSIYTKKNQDLSTQTQIFFRSSIYSLIKEVQNYIFNKLSLIGQVVNQLLIQNSEVKQIQKHTLNSNKELDRSIKILDEKIFTFEEKESVKYLAPLKQIQINFNKKQTEIMKNQASKQLVSNYFQFRKINLLNDLKTNILQDRKLKRKQIIKNKQNFVIICQQFLKHIENVIRKLNLKKFLQVQGNFFISQSQQKIKEKSLNEVLESQLRENKFLQKQQKKDNWQFYSPIDKLLEKRLKNVILENCFENCQQLNQFYVSNKETKEIRKQIVLEQNQSK